MNQTFKTVVDKFILFEFLEKNCEKNDEFYTFNMSSYKRAELFNNITEFIEKIKPYYHKSKQFYIEKIHSYTSLCTIIRQICKLNAIMFKKKIIYSKSKYNIPHFIYYS
jgi:exoribonuclease II